MEASQPPQLHSISEAPAISRTARAALVSQTASSSESSDSGIIAARRQSSTACTPTYRAEAHRSIAGGWARPPGGVTTEVDLRYDPCPVSSHSQRDRHMTLIYGRRPEGAVRGRWFGFRVLPDRLRAVRPWHGLRPFMTYDGRLLCRRYQRPVKALCLTGRPPTQGLDITLACTPTPPPERAGRLDQQHQTAARPRRTTRTRGTTRLESVSSFMDGTATVSTSDRRGYRMSPRTVSPPRRGLSSGPLTYGPR